MRINDYCGKCVHFGTCNTCPDIIEQDAQGDIFACRKFQSSENTSESGVPEKRVNKNEAKSVALVEERNALIEYCKSRHPRCSNCEIYDYCEYYQHSPEEQEWPETSINSAYDIIKPPVPAPGTAASATHYQLLTQQPIEIMQTLMTHEQFIGFLWGNCIKYALRLGHKDDAKSDAGKLAQYSKWLAQAENGEEVKP